jgi:hypothetical protein
MPNPWDRPSLGSPVRTGDYDADEIYAAVGRALSKWERLEGEMVHVYAVIIGGTSSRYLDAPPIRAFGTLNSPATRADMIDAAAKAMFWRLGFEEGMVPEKIDREKMEATETDLKDILKAYRGWMSRRNDIAHGYVRSLEHPDPTQKGDPLVTSYLLYPSDGSSGKWCIVIGEPAYAYKAKDIDRFGEAFEALEATVRAYAERLDEYRKEVRDMIGRH